VSDLAALIRLQARVMTFLAGLPVDRLKELADGRATLTVVDRAGDPPVVPVPAPVPVPANGGRARATSLDAEAVAARLLACESADEGAELLAALKPKAADLKLLAKALNIQPGRNMAETTEKILNLTLGGRKKHAALRQG